MTILTYETVASTNVTQPLHISTLHPPTAAIVMNNTLDHGPRRKIIHKKQNKQPNEYSFVNFN